MFNLFTAIILEGFSKGVVITDKQFNYIAQDSEKDDCQVQKIPAIFEKVKPVSNYFQHDFERENANQNFVRNFYTVDLYLRLSIPVEA